MLTGDRRRADHNLTVAQLNLRTGHMDMPGDWARHVDQ